MRPEQRLWRVIREHVTLWPKSHWVRIENEVGAGQPDVEYCVDGICGWLELKVWPRALERTQVLWSRERIKAGGAVHVLVRVKTALVNNYLLLSVEDYYDSQRLLGIPGLVLHQLWSLERDSWETLVEKIIERHMDKP